MRLPQEFYKVKLSALEQMISDLLVKIAQHNDKLIAAANESEAVDGEPASAPTSSATTTTEKPIITRFHSKQPPGISIPAYLKRIVQYSSLEKAVLLIILVYIDRVSQYHPTFHINSLTVHRFLIASVVVISKLVSDSYCTNSHYAKVGGVSVQELNVLELEFLFLLKWDLCVGGPQVDKYYLHLTQCTIENGNGLLTQQARLPDSGVDSVRNQDIVGQQEEEEELDENWKDYIVN